MHKLLAGAAALALAATAAAADQGQGKGNDGNRGGGQAAAQMKGNDGPAAKADRGPDKADRGPGKADRGREVKADPRPAQKADRGAARAERLERRDERGNGNAARANRGVVDRIDDDRGERRVVRVVEFDFGANRGLINGCPPGLAKKRNGCTPPGLLRERRESGLRFREAFYRPDWWGFGSVSDRVFYDDGYLYRLGRNNTVLGYIPLLGGALSVGNVWPSYYQPIPVPDYYVDYYNLGPLDSYRYADDVLYRVDPETAAITSIAALLTGDPIRVGQPMPTGYDVYNVPYPYRDRYMDRADALYRYSDGYVYQIDPTTQLVAAAIQLLT